MMEYFAYKKIKKHQAEKRAEAGAQTPIITDEDEHYLERIMSAEGTPPPLPARPSAINNGVAGDANGNKLQMVVHDGEAETEKEKETTKAKGKSKENVKGKDKESDTKGSKLGFIQRTFTKKAKKPENLHPTQPVSADEAESEEEDINKVLDELNLAAVNNRAFSISKESQELVKKFTVILKDLINGVPTAYDDLVNLLEDSQGTLAKSYDHLPSFLKKLITQLPNKLTSNLAPELLAVATEAQAFNIAGGASAATAGGLKDAAINFLKPTSLKDLVTKPGAVVSLLKAIMNALKLRWPAFMGTNVLLSLGLFVLLFVFWYCHKRGREVRLAKEAVVDSEGRIVEMEDDPMLEASGAGAGAAGSSNANGNLRTPLTGNTPRGPSPTGSRAASEKGKVLETAPSGNSKVTK
ncbi:hypothetical protein BP6252_05231 [Coleophoma cylindrospora]|uniref:Ring-like domain-containing protein n=1 Tax=Coleophoma cylindrospora TaxID=1849047 RepID=A0A3D8RT85_9HELO|nr:hypothetical protein BP6252_05231 [Coleophoma cylindrospora]